MHRPRFTTSGVQCECGAPTFPHGEPVELKPDELARLTAIALNLSERETGYRLALHQVYRQLELFMSDNEPARLTVAQAILEKVLEKSL